MEPLSLSHQKRIEDLLVRFPQETCEFAWPSLFAWRHGRRMFVLQVGDALTFVVPHGDGLALFGPPLGEISVAEAIDAIRGTTGKQVLACERITENAVHKIPNSSGWQLLEDRNNFDYIYRRDDLANLEGRKYHKKRNLIAQCLREHDCTYESYSKDLLPSLKEMQSRWCKAHNCGRTPGLCQEFLAINELLNHCSDFNLIGGVIKIHGTVQAYALGSRLNTNTVAVHFEKALPEFKGLYQLINQWVCQHEFGEFEYINREQDLGMEGLRKAKESYFPDHMVAKYIALNGISKDEYDQTRIRELRCDN